MKVLRLVAAAAVLLSGLAGSAGLQADEAKPGHAAAAIPPSASFEITGAVHASRTYTPESLKAERATTAIVYFNTGGGAVSASFRGVLLWTLLGEAGIAADPAIKNDILRRTVTVTGSDGYRIVLSGGELAPNLGAEPVLVAYERDGAQLGANEGFARLIVPGDKTGGRNVSSIVRIEVR